MNTLLQIAAEQGGFWPTDANGWLQLGMAAAVAVGAVLGFVWGVLMRPTRDAIAEIKIKLVEAIDEAHTAVGKSELIERQMESAAQGFINIHKDVAELRGELSSNALERRVSEMKTLEELGAIRVQLASIETELRMNREASIRERDR